MLKTKFEVLEDGKFVRLENGVIQDTKVSEDGLRFFTIDDPVEQRLIRKTFPWPSRAVQLVKDEYADAAVAYYGLFSSIPRVRLAIFLDRDAAKEQREQFLKESAYFDYKYIIRFGSKNSLSGYHFVTYGGYATYNLQDAYLHDSNEEASAKLKRYVAITDDIVDKIIKQQSIDPLLKSNYPDIIADLVIDRIKESDDNHFEINPTRNMGWDILEIIKGW